MPRGTRREFVARLATFGGAGAALVMSAPLRAAQRGLDKFLLPAPPCKDDLTPSVPPGLEYRTGAPLRRSLVQSGDQGRRMTLSGYVTGLACGRIKDARLDFWQADANGKLDTAGFQLRGAVLADKDGRYSIETIVPGSEGGRARRIGVRIEPPGKKPFTTALFFPDDVAATKDRNFKPNLAMKRVAGSSDAYTFDFLLDA
jgi:protocatechuate 3,4-dioxygenase beta subunit